MTSDFLYRVPYRSPGQWRADRCVGSSSFPRGRCCGRVTLVVAAQPIPCLQWECHCRVLFVEIPTPPATEPSPRAPPAVVSASRNRGARRNRCPSAVGSAPALDCRRPCRGSRPARARRPSGRGTARTPARHRSARLRDGMCSPYRRPAASPARRQLPSPLRSSSGRSHTSRLTPAVGGPNWAPPAKKPIP